MKSKTIMKRMNTSLNKKSHFFAFVSRMKYINRWGLMRNTVKENLAEHSLQVAMVTHALALIKNKLFAGNINAEMAAVMAMYHDTSEIFTGDLPTPIKYFNPSIKAAYKEVEAVSSARLTEMLPDELMFDYKQILDNKVGEIQPLIKAADKICAYLKCIEEEKAGNTEFKKAKASLNKMIQDFNLPEVNYFMETFAPSFSLSLDELD